MYGLIRYDQPMLIGQDSLLRNGPGLGLVPIFNVSGDGTPDNTLLHVSTDKTKYEFERYEAHMKVVWNEFKKEKSSQVDCDLKLNTRPDGHKEDYKTRPCKFQLDTLGKCKNPEKLLSEEKTLCVYMKINKIYGWLPQLVEGFDTPLIRCFGQNPADNENLGDVEYYPSVQKDGKSYGVIPHVFFPFMNQKEFTTPLVAIAFPKIANNVVVLVKCELFGLSSAGGDSKFELMVDS